MIYRTYYLSPLGRMLLTADDMGLVGAWFEGQKYFGERPLSFIFFISRNIQPALHCFIRRTYNNQNLAVVFKLMKI